MSGPVLRGVSTRPPADTPALTEVKGASGSVRVAAMEMFAGRFTADAGLNVYVDAGGLEVPPWLWGTPAAAGRGVEAGVGLMTLPISSSPDLSRESCLSLFPAPSASASWLLVVKLSDDGVVVASGSGLVENESQLVFGIDVESVASAVVGETMSPHSSSSSFSSASSSLTVVAFTTGGVGAVGIINAGNEA